MIQPLAYQTLSTQQLQITEFFSIGNRHSSSNRGSLFSCLFDLFVWIASLLQPTKMKGQGRNVSQVKKKRKIGFL